MHQRVGIQRQPLAHVGQPIGKVKSAKARPGITSRELLCCRHILEAEKAIQKTTDGDWDMTLSAPDNGALETKFEVAGRLETDFLSMDPWGIWIGMSLQAANKELISERASQS